MIFKFFNNLKFFISKINIYLKYKKKVFPLLFTGFFLDKTLVILHMKLKIIMNLFIPAIQ